MKTTQILYLVLFIGIVVWILKSTHLLDGAKEGFENLLEQPRSEPVIAKGVEPTRLDIQASPNSSVPGQLPYGPYLQTASVGSYQYQDPAQGPAELNQMKQLFEDIRSFLVFEGANVSNSSDPTVQLPLTQLRADSRKLQQEITVLKNNPGIKSSMTQQGLADIQEALTFLQRKVRLFQTSGVVSGGVEGFQDLTTQGEKTRATKADLQDLQTRLYGAILTLSASGTVDPVVQSRIKRLQDMYSSVTDMVNKLDKGLWTASDVPVYKEDIDVILPNLANPSADVMDIFSQKSGKKLSPVEAQLATLVGEDNASSVFKGIQDKGMFRVSLDLGYNVPGTRSKANEQVRWSKKMDLMNPTAANDTNASNEPSMNTSLPFDSSMASMDDRAPVKQNSPSGFDWKMRTESVCEQIRKRGLDPQDFGCIREGSLMSPAYSWRGHAKMVCGRLGATLDPDLPVVCGCPPSNWKGWNLSY